MWQCCARSAVQAEWVGLVGRWGPLRCVAGDLSNPWPFAKRSWVRPRRERSRLAAEPTCCSVIHFGRGGGIDCHAAIDRQSWARSLVLAHLPPRIRKRTADQEGGQRQRAVSSARVNSTQVSERKQGMCRRYEASRAETLDASAPRLYVLFLRFFASGVMQELDWRGQAQLRFCCQSLAVGPPAFVSGAAAIAIAPVLGGSSRKSDAVCIDLVWIKHVQGSGECKPQSGGQGSPQRVHNARQCAGQLQLVGDAVGVGSVSARPTCALWANPVNDDPQDGGQWLPTCCRRRKRRRLLRASRRSTSRQPSSYDSAASA